MQSQSHPERRVVRLREVEASDLPTFFEHQQDRGALHMAAFTAKDPADRAAFDAHWLKVMTNPRITARTIIVSGEESANEIAGHIMKFEMEARPEITYWLGREHWNKGIATEALSLFLREITIRPLFARAAIDNPASLRILNKCGFTIIARERGYANARKQEIDEALLQLT